MRLSPRSNSSNTRKTRAVCAVHDRQTCNLTFSYSERNWSECSSLLIEGFNVAVVFSPKARKDVERLPRDRGRSP